MKTLIVIWVLALDVFAQLDYSEFRTIKGEQTLSQNSINGFPNDDRIDIVTLHGLYEGKFRVGLQVPPSLIWSPPRGRVIVSYKQCSDKRIENGYALYLLMLDNGTRFFLKRKTDITLNGPIVIEVELKGSLPGAGIDGFKDFIGDDFYVLNTRGSNSMIWVSRDTGATWQRDSAGIRGIISNIALDSAQFVYAASDKGLFQQHPDSSIWHKIPNLVDSNVSAVFADRGHRLVAANAYYKAGWRCGVWISDDKGATWTQDSAGLGFIYISAFSDDALGNLYALGRTATFGSLLFRRAKSIPGWTRIDMPLTKQSLDTARNIISSVSGDSILFAATHFGVYSSKDQGATWVGPMQTPAQLINGLLNPSSNRFIASTGIGLFTHNKGDTTSWLKSYPDSGFLGGFSLLEGGPGEIFAHRFNSGPSTVLKSTNGGNSWIPDLVGRGIITSPAQFYVDELGNQYNLTNNSPPVVFTKPQGGAWATDSGWPVWNFGYSRGIGGDRAGNVFVALDSGRVYRRSSSGGAWALDTILPLGNAYLQWFWTGRNGSVFASPFNGPLHVRKAGRWSTISNPSLTPGGFSTKPAAVVSDTSGAIFAAYNSVYTSIQSRGVWVTNNHGSTWTKLGLDSIMVNGLVADGDTIYAATQQGIFAMTKSGLIGVAVHRVANAGSKTGLDRIYTQGGMTTFGFHVAKQGLVKLKVFDARGRQVVNLVESVLSPGVYTLSRKLNHLPYGNYYARLQSQEFSKARRFVVR